MSDQQYSGIGKRAVAVIIDFVVWGLIGYTIALVTGGTTGAGFELEGLPAFVWFLSLFVYYIVLEAEFGQTIGKKAVGIRVVTASGGPIEYRDSVVRNVLQLIDGIFFYLVGAVFVFFSDENKRPGDRVGNTVVVLS